MEQQNVAEGFILNVRHHKLGAAGCLCFLLGDCREAAPQMVQHIQPPDGAGNKQQWQQQRAAHECGDGYNDAHEDTCAIVKENTFPEIFAEFFKFLLKKLKVFEAAHLCD